MLVEDFGAWWPCSLNHSAGKVSCFPIAIKPALRAWRVGLNSGGKFNTSRSQIQAWKCAIGMGLQSPDFGLTVGNRKSGSIFNLCCLFESLPPIFQTLKPWDAQFEECVPKSPLVMQLNAYPCLAFLDFQVRPRSRPEEMDNEETFTRCTSENLKPARTSTWMFPMGE